MTRRWLMPAIGAAVLVVAVWAAFQARQAEEGFLDTTTAVVAGPVQHVLAGRGAPAARAAALDGEEVALLTAGRPAVVVYWTTW